MTNLSNEPRVKGNSVKEPKPDGKIAAESQLSLPLSVNGERDPRGVAWRCGLMIVHG